MASVKRGFCQSFDIKKGEEIQGSMFRVEGPKPAVIEWISSLKAEITRSFRRNEVIEKSLIIIEEDFSLQSK
jgi:hypothetical protein